MGCKANAAAGYIDEVDEDDPASRRLRASINDRTQSTTNTAQITAMISSDAGPTDVGAAGFMAKRPAAARKPSTPIMAAACIACLRAPGRIANSPQTARAAPTYDGI